MSLDTIKSLYLKYEQAALNKVDATALLNVHYPILAVLGYLLIVFNFFHMAKKSENRPAPNFQRNKFVKTVSIVHNALMAVFSLYIFATLVPYLDFKGIFIDFNPGKFLCSKIHPQWHKLDRIFWLFYVSKYYEFMDTFLIMAKGRKPSFLQYYHHAGVVLVMWSALRVRLPQIYLICLLNSFVHTLMYAWFCLVSLRMPVYWLKPIITTIQIVQFLLGLVLSFFALIQSDCVHGVGKFVFIFCNLYTIKLLVLFVTFFLESYCRNRGTKARGE